MSTTFRHNIKIIDTLQVDGSDLSLIRETSTLNAVLYSNGDSEYWIPRKVLESLGPNHYKLPDWFVKKNHWNMSGFDPLEASKDHPILIRENWDEVPGSYKYSMFHNGSVLASIISSRTDTYTREDIQVRLGEILDNKRASETRIQQSSNAIAS